MPETNMNSWFTAPAMTAASSQGSLHSSPDYLPSPESLLANTIPSTPATESQVERISALPSSMTTPGLREMTSVWSVSSSAPTKVRTRRAMTDAEKKEYRRKRLDGACADCRRRRRKVSIRIARRHQKLANERHSVTTKVPNLIVAQRV